MDSLLVLIFLGVIVVQVPIAFLISFDARRLNLENPEMYELGVLVPAGGLVVVFLYASRRRDLPRKHDNPDQNDT